ncbi:MAG: ATP-binding cassette domain-containing protein [Clostridiales bacterium]|nr:ATP-binding cassette domain-containing protein [Candidatus Crickella equi]
MKNNWKKWSLIAVFWLVLWEVLALIVGNTLLLPGPMDTVRALAALLVDGTFYMDALATIGRCLAAMVLALIAGTLLSICAYKWHWVRDVLSLPVSLFKTIPIMAVAIYMILLMSAGSVPVLVCWIMCFPIVYTNLLAGLDSMDVKLLEMAKIYKIEGSKLVRWVYMPSLYPHFRSAMSLVAGMSWKAIVTAEVLSIPQLSLGYELMNAKYYLTTDRLFAYVVVLILISVVFERLIKKLVALLGPHAYEYSKVAKGAGAAGQMADVASESAAVEMTGINKSFGEKVVLKDFNMTLEPGKVTAIMGASGSGKTTIARIIAGLETPDSGTVRVTGPTASYLFQEDRLLPWLNVYDNLAIVNPDDSRIASTLKAVGLSTELYKLPGELSGGMSYRVAMARAFLYDAGLLIADEPFRGLDSKTRSDVIKNLWLSGTKDKTVLLITHSQEDAELANKIIKL